ncbi:MAG: sigma-70 family RNA polymerase sigma factor [Planctomycetes bacterium]|nr:sigma-70 family RNA polymerase sigma factor [Planctomycetota bacterium]
MDPGTEILRGRTRLPDTRWSVLLAQERGSRWDELIQGYWRPIYRYVRRHWGCSNEDAKDRTQEFLLSLIEDRALDRLAPEHGKFRHYVKACLDNFMRNARRGERALKRGGGRARMSLDFVEALSVAEGPAVSFDAEWRRALLEEELAGIEEEYRRAGKPQAVEIFRRYCLEGGETYRSLATRMGLTEDDVDNLLRDAKARFRERIIKRVRETVATREDLEEELAALFQGAPNERS